MSSRGRSNAPSAHDTSPTTKAHPTAEPSDATVNPGTSAAAKPNAIPFTTR